VLNSAFFTCPYEIMVAGASKSLHYSTATDARVVDIYYCCVALLGLPTLCAKATRRAAQVESACQGEYQMPGVLLWCA
jgi:hypothetical protein